MWKYTGVFSYGIKAKQTIQPRPLLTIMGHYSLYIFNPKYQKVQILKRVWVVLHILTYFVAI